MTHQEQVVVATANADHASTMMWGAIKAGKPQETIDRLSHVHDYYEGIARRAITGLLVGVDAESALFADPTTEASVPHVAA